MGADEFTGRRIKDFIIQERIGRGGMAVVYRATQPSVNRDVALKIIRLTDESIEDDFKRRFAQEAAVVASLEHIHILPIYDYGIDGDVAFLAMRLLRGGTLKDMLLEGPLPLGEADRLFNQFARALAYAHSKGVIHRDLKPNNIMLDEQGNAFLTDFGLAKIIESEHDLTKTGNVVGTPNYMSPEQLRGERIDYRSDVYSLGIVLYHMLTGQVPFDSANKDLVSVIYKQLEEAPPLPSSLNPELPAEIEAVVLRALEKKPENRYTTVMEMLTGFNQALGKPDASTLSYTPATPRLPVQAAKPAAPAPTRDILLGGGLVALLALAAIVLLLVLTGQGGGSLPLPTVVADTSILGAELVPNASMIADARTRLGSGFIAYFACTRQSEYHAVLSREIVRLADSYNLPLRLYDGDGDGYRQLTQIEEARSDGATAFIVCPLDSALVDASLRAAQDAGVFVVIYGSDDAYGGVTLIGDDYGLGQKIGRYAGQVIADELGGQAEVIILDFPSLPSIVQRANGLEDGMREFAPNVNVIGRYEAGTPENGERSMNTLLAQGVSFNVVLSINDGGAFGAIRALEDAQVPPDAVLIFGVDAEQLAVQYIRDGYYMRGTIQIDTQLSAHSAVNAMVYLLSGSTIAEQVLTPPGEIVTRESLLAESTPEATAAPTP